MAVAIGGVAWVFVYPILSGERHAERRKASVARAEPMASAADAGRAEVAPRTGRRHAQGDRTAAEDGQARAARRYASRRPGLTWSKRRFLLTAGALGAAAFLLALPTGAGLLAALGFAFAAGGGLPLWLLSFLKKRREARFLDTFPDAVDVIVRGIKAGLPLLDSFKLIATDAEEPVRSEFRAIIETQAIGLPLGEACLKLYERMPLAGSELLRHRHLDPATRRRQSLGSARQPFARPARPQTHESEDPGHVDGGQGLGDHHRCAAARGDGARLFHQPAIHRAAVDDPMGHVMLAGCALWMTMGILVMRKMINFDF